MREIKFRAWNKKLKMMVDHFWIYSDGGAYDIPSHCHDTPHIEIESTDDLILMQYTGLKDVDGVELYERDIVSHDGIGIGEVVYDDSAAAFKIKFQGQTRKWFVDMLEREYDSLKVIGNIHENGELLK